MVGGAWPFLVGGVICLVNSVNERDRCLLNSSASEFHWLGTSQRDVHSIRCRKIAAITGL